MLLMRLSLLCNQLRQSCGGAEWAAPIPLSVQAQRTKATVPLLREAKRVVLLTGTPALNKPKARLHVPDAWFCRKACNTTFKLFPGMPQELFQQLAALIPTAKLKVCCGWSKCCNSPHVAVLRRLHVMSPYMACFHSYR